MAGAILYAATITRPDLSYYAGVLARYISKWNFEHYKAAKHLLRYIQGTSDLCLTVAQTRASELCLAMWMQTGVVILTQDNQPLVMFSRYLELLWLVELLWPGKASDNQR
jgi:hypothetical protein